uniref:complement component C8 gamma chain isoform X1 n=1 Tax=Urocitellus parryii TaxID=9999 RepID=UPI000E55AC7D|nr:complement component C8 gamma chain isoform X1 [Urocitellus parryii]
MLPLETPLLLTLLLVANSLAQRVRPPRPPTLISSIQPKARFNAQQFSGTWLLVGVGSACRFLQEQGHQAEATTLHVTPQGAAMVINTSRKLDGICWQVRQLYRDTEVPGRFLLQAQGARAPVHMVVAATDYQGFAILYLERARQLSVKLYARSLPVSDSVLSVFEQQVKSANLTEDQILYFPKYGFCKAADQFHILDGEWAAGQLASGHSAGSFLPLAESPVCCRSEGARPAGAVMGHLLPSSVSTRAALVKVRALWFWRSLPCLLSEATSPWELIKHHSGPLAPFSPHSHQRRRRLVPPSFENPLPSKVGLGSFPEPLSSPALCWPLGRPLQQPVGPQGPAQGGLP